MIWSELETEADVSLEWVQWLSFSRAPPHNTYTHTHAHTQTHTYIYIYTFAKKIINGNVTKESHKLTWFVIWHTQIYMKINDALTSGYTVHLRIYDNDNTRWRWWNTWVTNCNIGSPWFTYPRFTYNICLWTTPIKPSMLKIRLTYSVS